MDIDYCSVEYKVCNNEANAFSISQPTIVPMEISGVDTICAQDHIVIEGKFQQFNAQEIDTYRDFYIINDTI